MDVLELSDKEETCLRELVVSAVSDLRGEIAHTDSPVFKKRLRERKDTLTGIANRLEALHATPSG